jgi:hypothetical protein
VAAAYYDYSNDRGVVIGRGHVRRHFGEGADGHCRS